MPSRCSTSELCPLWLSSLELDDWLVKVQGPDLKRVSGNGLGLLIFESPRIEPGNFVCLAPPKPKLMDMGSCFDSWPIEASVV